ncbi:unnamed protein product [Prunus brigantina]
MRRDQKGIQVISIGRFIACSTLTSSSSSHMGTLEEKCRGFAAAQHSKLREKPVHLRSHLSQ